MHDLDQVFVFEDRETAPGGVPGNPVLLHQCGDRGQPGAGRQVTRSDPAPQVVSDLAARWHSAPMVNHMINIDTQDALPSTRADLGVSSPS